MRKGSFLVALLFIAASGHAREERKGPGLGLVDSHIQKSWEDAGVAPTRVADDAEFLRRLSLDVLGTIPSAEEALAFIQDARSDKRVRKINEILSRPEYAQHWAEVWEDILIGYDNQNRQQSKRALYAWLRDECFAKNRPYDQMAQALITAKGVNQEYGAVNFILRQGTKGAGAINIASKVAKTFLCTQIQCAQCHDHPFDRYTQEDFYGMVGFFARVAQKKVDAKDQKDQRVELYENVKGDASYGEGKDRKTVAPRFLDGATPDPAKERREEFARLLIRRDNLQFARAVVNRYWAHFFGRGIVHPVEDFSGRFKPSHPELLDELAREFVAWGYDLKWLVWKITGSRTYQLSSRVSPKKAPHERYFAVALTRPLTPEQIYAAMTRVLNADDAPATDPKVAEKMGNAKDNLLREFRKFFGDEENVDIGTFNGTIQQALLLMNGGTVNQGIAGKGSRLGVILKERDARIERLRFIFLTVLTRLPSDREQSTYLPYVTAAGGKREAYEDVYWTLVNSSEFLFNH